MKSIKEIRESVVSEGNPLARLHTHIGDKRHFVGISAERSGLNQAENDARMHELKGHLRSQGYGYKHARGVWEGGSENSLIVHAKEKGAKSGTQLRRDMQKVGAHFGQDAIFHHNGRNGRLVGTNDTGFPGKGKQEKVGKVAYNQPDAPFQTQFKKHNRSRSRPKDASFTTK